jgi:PAS domain S-box-containing protein
MHYKMEVIPTTFEDGEPGFTLLFEDITEKERHLKNMEFLTRTAMDLVDLPLNVDIYQYIAKGLMELIPNPRLYIHSYDELKGQFFMRAIVGQEFRDNAKFLSGGKDIIGMGFPLKDFFMSAPFFESPSTMKGMRELRFSPFFEDEAISFYDACVRKFPKDACDDFIRKYSIGKLYVTGLVWHEQLFGVVGICHGPDEDLENQQAIESFLRQASIAIARRQTEERLSRSEQRFAELVSNGFHSATVLVRDGRIALVNPRFTETFGYTKVDMPTLQDWFSKAVPDPEHRTLALTCLDSGQSDKGDYLSQVFPVRCRNGEEKQAEMHPVFLSDGTQVVSFRVNTPAR